MWYKMAHISLSIVTGQRANPNTTSPWAFRPETDTQEFSGLELLVAMFLPFEITNMG